MTEIFYLNARRQSTQLQLMTELKDINKYSPIYEKAIEGLKKQYPTFSEEIKPKVLNAMNLLRKIIDDSEPQKYLLGYGIKKKELQRQDLSNKHEGDKK